MFAGLPEYSFYTTQLGEVVKIRRGVNGYFKADVNGSSDELNESLGITRAHSEAMYVGSLFGWETPGANHANYDDKGEFRRSSPAKPGSAKAVITVDIMEVAKKMQELGIKRENILVGDFIEYTDTLCDVLEDLYGLESEVTDAIKRG